MAATNMQPSPVLTAFKPLDGKNFREWDFRIRTLLRAEGLLSQIENDKPESIDDKWKAKDAKAMRFITERIESEQLELIITKTTAKEIIDELTVIYNRKSQVNTVRIKRQLMELRFKEGEDAVAHLTQFEKLINQLRGFGETVSDTDIVTHLQLTFPPSFDNVIAYFDALPTDDRTAANLKARFLQEASIKHDRAGSSIGKPIETAAFKSSWSQSRGSGQSFRGRNRGRGYQGQYYHGYSRGNQRGTYHGQGQDNQGRQNQDQGNQSGKANYWHQSRGSGHFFRGNNRGRGYQGQQRGNFQGQDQNCQHQEEEGPRRTFFTDGPVGSKMRAPSKWHIPCTVVVCLATFLSITYYLNSDFQYHVPTPVTWTAAVNWSEEIPTKIIFATHRLTESPNNVFFIETSCASDQRKFVRQGLILKPQQACAVYSAAYHNPSKQVFLIFTCPLLRNFYTKSPAVTQALLDLPNFSLVEANLTEIYAHSPLSAFLNGRLRESKYPVEHNADILRILLVYLFGGTYMDLDVVSTRPLDDLGTNYIGAQQTDQLGTGVFNFEARHPYLKEILLESWQAYDPNAWAAVGPILATSVLRKYCNLTDLTNLETTGSIPYCGITVWGYKVFYPIRYPDWALYWSNDSWSIVEPMLKETYVAHVWNHMSEGALITVGSEQPYAKLAEQNCATVYSHSGKVF